MTTPTTNLALSAIQTEFGGANPISMSEYIRGGTYVPSGQATSGTDGTAIPTSTSGIRIGMFRGLTKTSNISGGSTTANNVASSLATRTATFRLNSDGTTQRSNGASLSTILNWYAPTTAGIGSSYWARATVTTAATGGTLSGAYGGWNQLTSGGSWAMTNSTTSSEGTGSISIDIAASSGGPVLGTWTVNFDAGYAA